MREKWMRQGAAAVCCAAALIFAVSAGAQEETAFSYNETNERLEEYHGAGGEVTVPAMADGHEVEVLFNTFNSIDTVTGIVIPEGVKVLDNSAIYALPALTSVVLPESLEVIGNYVFAYCDALTSVRIPPAVFYIGNSAFFDCENLTSITFTGMPPAIDADAFYGLPDDAVITVPADQYDAYEAVLPDDVMVEASEDPAIAVDDTTPEDAFGFDEATGTITSIDSDVYYVNIPAEIRGVPVKAIGKNAASSFVCKAYRMTIPEGVETIDAEAFSSLRNLASVDFPSTLRTIGESAFRFFIGRSITIPDGVETIGKEAFFGSSLIGELHLPRSLTTIEEGAFQRSWGLGEAYFPETIETIGANAFAETSINYLNFAGTTLPRIDESAFAGLTISDVDMDWHTTMKQVREYQAYFDGLGIATTVWSNNPASYGVAHYVGYQLGDAYAATYRNLDDDHCELESYSGTAEDISVYTSVGGASVTGVGDGCLADNPVIKSFYPHHCGWFTTVGARAFAGSTLEQIDLFDSITVLGEEAFRDCKSLAELTLPDSLTQIGTDVIDGCDNLKTVTVRCDTRLLEDDVFANCAYLKAHPEGIVLPADTSDEEVARLSDGMGLAWYEMLRREGEARAELTAMPFAPTEEQYFEVDPETGTLTAYTGTDADVIVPREIGGVTVRAIGYNTFEACRDYTNTGMSTNQTRWVPLRSIVLPETVTEISDSAFSYCQQLETFVCYGPAASTGRGTFSYCRNLQQVIFVNGVGLVDNYVFDGVQSPVLFCSPQPARSIGEYAFENCAMGETDVLSPAAVPDIDAILRAYEEAPYDESVLGFPEETEPMTAAPVGEAGEPYLGVWLLAELNMGGEEMDPAALDMDGMYLFLYEDGTSVCYRESEGAASMVWMVGEDGAAYCEEMRLTLQDGSLVAEEDGIALVFTAVDPSEAPSVS